MFAYRWFGQLCDGNISMTHSVFTCKLVTHLFTYMKVICLPTYDLVTLFTRVSCLTHTLVLTLARLGRDTYPINTWVIPAYYKTEINGLLWSNHLSNWWLNLNIYRRSLYDFWKAYAWLLNVSQIVVFCKIKQVYWHEFSLHATNIDSNQYVVNEIYFLNFQ